MLTFILFLMYSTTNINRCLLGNKIYYLNLKKRVLLFIVMTMYYLENLKFQFHENREENIGRFCFG